MAKVKSAPASQEHLTHLERATYGSLFFSAVSLIVAGLAYHASEKSAVDNQRTTLFLQFEQQYYAIAARFPAKVHDPDFRPDPRSDDYTRLQAYWIFCYSEWYATQRLEPTTFGDLWGKYYEPLIATGLKIPSLRYVLEDIVRTHGVGSGDWTAFLRELASIAARHHIALDQIVLKQINGKQVAQVRVTDVSLASQVTRQKR